jgi:hypothetical protein
MASSILAQVGVSVGAGLLGATLGLGTNIWRQPWAWSTTMAEEIYPGESHKDFYARMEKHPPGFVFRPPIWWRYPAHSNRKS